jgi:predicted RecB family nuclease
MENSVDVNNLFSKCMNELISERLTATTVAAYITSPFSIYCNKFVSKEEQDPMTEYQKLLFQRGCDHENQTVHEKFPEMSEISFDTPENGFKSTLDAMVSGTDILHGMPIYYLPEGIFGITDLLEKSNSTGSVFGNYHYTVKEVKLAKNIKNSHLIQGAFYNYLIGQIQNFTPKTFAMINGEGEESVHEYSEYESVLLDSIEGTRKILQGEPISPTHGSCDYPWTSYCNKKAVETNDISLVTGISLKTKNQLFHKFKTVEELSRASILDLTAIKGIGDKTAIKYVNTAKAIHSGTHNIIDTDKINFPQRKVEIFLDLEGIDPTMAEDGIPQIDYLIGILVRENSEEKYISFTAKNTNLEKEMLLEFLDFLRDQKDYVIYHYHHYEKTHMTKMMEKYEIDNATQNLLLDNLIDIHKVATDSVVFPTYGNGLKQIAPYLGFSWRHKDVSATESISIYLEYIQDPEGREKEFQKVIDYNEDDCIATRVIKDWLASIITPKS